MTAHRFIDAEKARHTVRMICRVIGVGSAQNPPQFGEQREHHHPARRATRVVTIVDGDHAPSRYRVRPRASFSR